MKFRPKYKHDCRACVFLGRYKFMAGFMNGERKVMVDLFCCTGIDASVIARYGHGDRYASCPTDMLTTLEHAAGTFSDGLREAVRRAIAIGLIPTPSPAKTNWTNGESVRITIDVQADTTKNAGEMLELAKANALMAMEGKGGKWEGSSPNGQANVRVSFAPWVDHSKRIHTEAATPPPLDPLPFLRSLAADAIERAERLEVWAAKTHDTQARTNHIEAAQKYRARAEAHQIAIVEMDRAMATPKPNGVKS